MHPIEKSSTGLQGRRRYRNDMARMARHRYRDLYLEGLQPEPGYDVEPKFFEEGGAIEDPLLPPPFGPPLIAASDGCSAGGTDGPLPHSRPAVGPLLITAYDGCYAGGTDGSLPHSRPAVGPPLITDGCSAGGTDGPLPHSRPADAAGTSAGLERAEDCHHSTADVLGGVGVVPEAPSDSALGATSDLHHQHGGPQQQEEGYASDSQYATDVADSEDQEEINSDTEGTTLSDGNDDAYCHEVELEKMKDPHYVYLNYTWGVHNNDLACMFMVVVIFNSIVPFLPLPNLPLDDPISAVWRMSLIICTQLFLLAVLTRTATGIINLFSRVFFAPLLAFAGSSFISPLIGMEIAYLSTAWAAGMFGYSLAEYRQHAGTEQAANIAATRNRTVLSKKERRQRMRTIAYYLASFPASIPCALISHVLWTYFFGLEMLIMAAFFGHVLAIYDRYRELISEGKKNMRMTRRVKTTAFVGEDFASAIAKEMASSAVNTVTSHAAAMTRPVLGSVPLEDHAEVVGEKDRDMDAHDDRDMDAHDVGGSENGACMEDSTDDTSSSRQGNEVPECRALVTRDKLMAEGSANYLRQ